MEGSSKYAFHAPVNAGMVGDGHVENFNQDIGQAQTWDLPALALELAKLRKALMEAGGTEHSTVVEEIGAATGAADNQDEKGMLQHLARAGQWAFDTATEIGTTIAAEAIKRAMFPSP